jgi:hypothetical protein
VGNAGKKKNYVRPRIIYREAMELMAVACSPPGKGSPGSCPTGPISS